MPPLSKESLILSLFFPEKCHRLGGGVFHWMLDNFAAPRYNAEKCIGQFVTILSVNKTRDSDGRSVRLFVLWARIASIFSL